MQHEMNKRQAERSERAAEAARAAVMVRSGARNEQRMGWRNVPTVALATGWGSSRN